MPRRIRRTREKTGCSRCGHPSHDFAALPGPDYAYLLGLYLGDGCISKAPKGVFRLRIVLDRQYPGIIQECAAVMSAVMPTSKVGVVRHKHERADEVSSFSRAWPCLFPQHGTGKKHLRRIYLSRWQKEIVDAYPRQLLRGLIHSDGCRSINTIRHPKKTYVYPRYLFSNCSPDIRGIFCDYCDYLGIKWRVMNEFNISIARADSIAKMDEFIGPKQ